MENRLWEAFEEAKKQFQEETGMSKEDVDGSFDRIVYDFLKL